MPIVGSVSVSVVPSAEGFNDALREQLLPEADELGEEIGEHIRDGIEEALADTRFTVGADTEEADADIDDLKAKVDDLTGDVTVTADTEEADADLDRLDEKLADLDTRDTALTVTADTTEADESLTGLTGNLDTAAGSTSELSGSTSELRQQADRLGASVGALSDWVAELDGAMASGDASADELASAVTNVNLAGRNAGDALRELGETVQGLAASEAEGAAGADAEATSLGHLRDNAAEAGAALKIVQSGNDSALGGGGGGGGGAGLLMGLAAAALAIAPAFITAASGVAIFAAAAIPDIDQIVHHLGPYRAGLDEIKAEYKALNEAVKPEVITGFDEAVTQAGQILPEFTSVARAGGVAVDQLINSFGNFLQSGDTKQFISFLGGEIPSNVHAFSNALQGGATLIYGFTESLDGISKTLLSVAGGLLSFGGEVLKEVPWLGQWTVALGAAYFASAKLPPILQAIATSNFAQWLTGSSEGLLAFRTAFTTAAAGMTLFEADEGAITAEMAVMAAALDNVIPPMSVLTAETTAAAAESAALQPMVGALVAELAALDPELVGGAAGIAALDAAMAAATVETSAWAGALAVLDAVNPLVWAAAGVVAIGALVGVMVNVGSATGSLIAEMAAQDHATGSNIAGYQKLSAQLSGTSGQMVVADIATREAGGAFDEMHLGINETSSALVQVTDAQKAAADKAAALRIAVVGVASGLSITITAAAKVAADMSIIGSNSDTTKQKLAAFGNEITILTGFLNTLWQSQLTVAQSLLTVQANAKTAGASMTGANQASITLQTSFAQGIAVLDKYAESQTRGGKMTQATSDYLAEQTAKLALLTGGNQNAIAEVEGMIAQEILWGAKTGDVNKVVTNLASSIDGAMVGSLKKMGISSSETDTLIAHLTASILRTGAASGSTEGAREALIRDLEALGVKASVAERLVNSLVNQIAALHSKTVDISVNVAEHGGAPGTGIGAYGSRLTAAGGTVIPGYQPGRDTVPAMLSPGESVLVPELTRAIGPDQIMAWNREYGGGRGSSHGHFAGGGTAGGWGSPPWQQGSSGPGSDYFQIFLSVLASAAPYSTKKTGIDDAERLAQEFSDGTLKTVTEIRDAGNEAITALRDYYTGPHAKELENALGRQTTALETLATRSASIATEISNMKSYANQEKSSLASFTDLSSITPGTDANGNPLPVTGATIQSSLQADLATLRKFYNIIGQLKKAKVDKTLIQQVIALGPAAGVTYGEAILAGGASLIKELNAEEASINKIDTAIGERAADIQYGQNISKGFLSGLHKDQSKLDEEMKRLGDEIAIELAKALHAKIPPAATAHVSAAAVTAAVSAGASSINGLTSTASAISRTQAADIVSTLRHTDNTTLQLATKAQATRIIALLELAPKATGTAAGTAVADVLNKTASSAAAKARARVRG